MLVQSVSNGVVFASGDIRDTNVRRDVPINWVTGRKGHLGTIGTSGRATGHILARGELFDFAASDIDYVDILDLGVIRLLTVISDERDPVVFRIPG